MTDTLNYIRGTLSSVLAPLGRAAARPKPDGRSGDDQSTVSLST